MKVKINWCPDLDFCRGPTQSIKYVQAVRQSVGSAAGELQEKFLSNELPCPANLAIFCYIRSKEIAQNAAIRFLYL